MKRTVDYKELHKHFIPRRTILFVKGKLNTSAPQEKVLNARNIWVAWWSRTNSQSETLSTIDGLNRVDCVFMRRPGTARKFNSVGYVGIAKIADPRLL